MRPLNNLPRSAPQSATTTTSPGFRVPGSLGDPRGRAPSGGSCGSVRSIVAPVMVAVQPAATMAGSAAAPFVQICDYI